MSINPPTASAIRSANRNAVGGGRKRCRKGKNCSATCIAGDETCLVGLPESVGVATTKVSNMLQQRGGGKMPAPAATTPAPDRAKPEVEKTSKPKAKPEPKAKEITAEEVARLKKVVDDLRKAKSDADAAGDAEEYKKINKEYKKALIKYQGKLYDYNTQEGNKKAALAEEIKKSPKKAEEPPAKQTKAPPTSVKPPSGSTTPKSDAKIPASDEKFLKEAIEFINAREAKEVAGLFAKYGLDKLSPEERGALTMYGALSEPAPGRAMYYRALNQLLRYGEIRGDSSPDTKAAAEWLKAKIPEALEKLPNARLSEFQHLERGLGGRTAEQLKNLKVGDVFQDRGVGSYSTRGETVSAFAKEPGDVVIRVRNPRSAKDVRMLMPNEGEAEHLYAPGKQFRLVEVEKNGYWNDLTNTNHTIYHVEEVD